VLLNNSKWLAFRSSYGKRVIEKANCRCEYCGLSQAGQEATFHIDHIIPVVGGGETALDNERSCLRILLAT
jgi:hypothetical protein